MKILSIHDGHTATACYLKDGKIVSMVSEERFTNKKNQAGFPEESVKYILQKNSLSLTDLDFIAFPHIIAPIDFNQTYGGHYSFRHRLFYYFDMLMPVFIKGSNKIVRPYIQLFKGFRKKVINKYSRKYGFKPEQICQVEHHIAHGYAALYGSGFTLQDEPILVFTMDGSGDGISSRVAIWQKGKGYMNIHESSSFNSVGELYSRVTQFLGMKAGEHEYKLMGMSPYVSDDKSEKVFKIFMRYLDVDEHGCFKNTRHFGHAILNELRRDMAFIRFDNICAGIQRHFEHVVMKWVKFWAERTKIRKAVFGGGCFMNVKCNKLISEAEYFDEVYFCPSCGDESTAFGAAYWVAEKKGEKHIEPLHSLYLGQSFTNDDIESVLKNYSNLLTWEKCADIEKRIAELLVNWNIIGRFKGAAEWGARALGGRSILCRADDLRVIHRLNKAIKSRDFWMPFAASVIEEDADRYFKNYKKVRKPYYMTVTFDTTAKARNDIAAGIHPFDFSCRAQLVNKEICPDYHRLLVYFKELTGFSGLLNTSFNLHGFPICGTPESAINTLLNSNLDYLALENFLIKVKEGVRPKI